MGRALTQQHERVAYWSAVLDAFVQEAPGTTMSFMRLRAVALAAVDLLPSLAPMSEDVSDAFETLAGLRCAHIYTYLRHPPLGPLDRGRHAALVFDRFINARP